MTCPDCITKLIPETRKTRIGKRVFMTCPKCGYNEMRSTAEYDNTNDLEIFYETKKLHNNNSLLNENEND